MRSLVAAALLSLAASAHALDGVSLVYGEGNHVGVYAVEVRSGDWRRWQLGESWRLSAYGVGSVAYWRAREESAHKELWDFAIAPVLRLERPEDAEEIVSAACALAFESDQQVAVLISQRMLGRKKWTETK